ncbi:MAG: glycosyltransferase [Alphaproteobacteria bacterium]
MMRNLLVVIGDLDVGGTERHLVQVLSRLPRERYRVQVYALSHKGELAPELEAAGVPVIGPPFSAFLRHALGRVGRRTLLLAVSAARLCLLMLRERPAVVHLFLPEAYVVGALCALLTRCPVRVMSRRSLNVYQRNHPIVRRVERWLHRRMQAVLGNSAAVVGELRAEGAPAARLGLIYNGVDLAPYTAERSSKRAELGIDESALVMVIVANLIAYKGHADLLDALGTVRDSLPEGWLLLCAGRDDGRGKALRAQAAGHGLGDHVRWLGERSDVPALLCCADIGILCSHQEGFANAILEGMAAGLPMVVTDVGGNREAVVDGLTGMIVPPRDPGVLGGAVLSLAREPARRKAMGEAGRRRAADRFSLDACVARYERLYGALTANHREPLAAVLEEGAEAAASPPPQRT